MTEPEEFELTCDWCEKPRIEWTSNFRWQAQGRFYCSVNCYSAGAYELNRYLCTLPPILLGVISFFVISQLFMNLTLVTILTIVTLILVWIFFSSASFTFVILGRKLRYLREQGRPMPE